MSFSAGRSQITTGYKEASRIKEFLASRYRYRRLFLYIRTALQWRRGSTSEQRPSPRSTHNDALKTTPEPHSSDITHTPTGRDPRCTSNMTCSAKFPQRSCIVYALRPHFEPSSSSAIPNLCTMFSSTHGIRANAAPKHSGTTSRATLAPAKMKASTAVRSSPLPKSGQ